MQDLYDLKENLLRELKTYAKRDKLDMASLQQIDTLAHSLKNLCKVIEDEEMKMNDYSQMSMPRMPRMSYGYGYDYDMSYARGRGSNVRRDSMGRYSSRDGGYSNHGDFRMELQDLINSAPNEQVRQKMAEAMGMM
jgi:hypothetical protein